MVGFGVTFFFYLTRSVGISPFDMKQAIMAPKLRTNTTSITFKLVQMLPTYLAISIYTICMASIFWQRQTSSEIGFAANWLQFMPNALSYLVALYMGIRYRSVSSEVLLGFYFCDEKLRDSLGVSFVTSNRKSEIYSYLASFVSMILGITLAYSTFTRTVDMGNIWTFLYWLSFCIPKFTLLLFNMQLVSCIFYVVSRIRLLRTAAVNFLTSNSDVMVAFMGDNYEGTAKVTPLNSKRIYNTKESQLKYCNDLMDVVLKLQNITDLLNKYFGKQLVLNLLSGFICITVQMHYMIRHVRFSFSSNGAEILVTISLTLIGMHVLEYFIIFGSGDKAKSVWNFLVSELHRLRILSNEEEIKSKLGDIINCMCYKRVEFHGCHLFTIDLSAITGIISSIATYLIVFVQFQINEEQSKDSDGLFVDEKTFSAV